MFARRGCIFGSLHVCYPSAKTTDTTSKVMLQAKRHCISANGAFVTSIHYIYCIVRNSCGSLISPVHKIKHVQKRQWTTSQGYDALQRDTFEVGIAY